MAEFVIHALPVAGGILAISPLPGVNGQYSQDLEHVTDWKPALVITLTSEVEMLERGAADLGHDLQEAGTRWAHLPLADFSRPTPEQEQHWHQISRSALAALKGGGRVLIHCRGGCGRSGMAALRLMIEAGEEPDAALRRLRAVRPCAVETEAQMAWARRG